MKKPRRVIDGDTTPASGPATRRWFPRHVQIRQSRRRVAAGGNHIDLVERAKDQRDVKCTIHPPIFANLVAEQPAGLVVEVWGGLTESTYLEWIIKHAAKFLRGVMLSEGGPNAIPADALFVRE